MRFFVIYVIIRSRYVLSTELGDDRGLRILQKNYKQNQQQTNQPTNTFLLESAFCVYGFHDNHKYEW